MLVLSMLLYTFCLDSRRSQEEHCSLETPRLISSFEYLGKERYFLLLFKCISMASQGFLAPHMLRENSNKTLFGLVLYYKGKGYVQNSSAWVTRQKSLSALNFTNSVASSRCICHFPDDCVLGSSNRPSWLCGVRPLITTTGTFSIL